MTRRERKPESPMAGYSLIELLIVLVVISIGILMLARLLPSATREQLQDRLRTAGSYYAQEKVEALRGLQYNDMDVQPGLHPAAGTEAVGPSSAYQRYYTIVDLDPPLDNIRRLTVLVRWQTPTGLDSVTATTYLNR